MRFQTLTVARETRKVRCFKKIMVKLAMDMIETIDHRHPIAKQYERTDSQL